MKAVLGRAVLRAACVLAIVLPGCSDDDPAHVEKLPNFTFEVRVTDPAGAPIEGLRVAAGSLIPCEFMQDCIGTAMPSRSPQGPQSGATLQFTVEADSRVVVTVHDRNGGHVRTVLDDSMQRGLVYNVVWNGRDDAGSQMPSGVYEFCMVATDLESGAVLYQPDCFLASLFTLIEVEAAADAVGHTGADGRLRVTSRLPFPYLYGDTLSGYDADGAFVGTYSYTDEVSINVVDESSGNAQRFIRTITDGRNHFDLVFDPPGGLQAAPPAQVSAPTPESTAVDPGQTSWSFGPMYPNPFN